MTTLCRLGLVSLLALAPGCAAFRCQVGFGFGVGADVQVLGLHHVGAMLGKYHEFGPNYGRGYYCKSGYSTLGPLHSTKMEFIDEGVMLRPTIEHFCLGMFPGPFGLISGDDPPAERWAFEVGIAMTAIELRFGVNPVAAALHEAEQQPQPQRPHPQPTASASTEVHVHGHEPPPPPAPPPPPPDPATSYCEECGARLDVCGCAR